MRTTNTAQLAEALLFVHGSCAETEAARQAALCENMGAHQAAAQWRSVELHIALQRHPPQLQLPIPEDADLAVVPDLQCA